MQYKLTTENIPSLYRSALISAGGVALALAFLWGLKLVLPTQDFTTVEAMIATAVGAWVVNLVKVFVSDK